MNQYNLNNAKFGTHNLIVSDLETEDKILDVGCNKGYLIKLTEKGYFYGVDNDAEDLRIAKENGYIETHKLDLNDFKLFQLNKKFDVIIFADILEHLVYPLKVLKHFSHNYLTKKGKIIISLPNVANFSVRFRLLFGSFDYTESGILDKTHLHLYTSKSAIELIEKSGLRVLEKKYSSNNLGWLIKKLPFLGCLFGYNLIFVCEKKY